MSTAVGKAPDAGPIIGECTSSRVRIMITGPRETKKYHGIAGVYLDESCIQCISFRLHTDFDNTGMAIFNGLICGLQYQYRIGVRKISSKHTILEDLVDLPQYSFSVHKTDETECSVNLISNRYFVDRFLRQSDHAFKHLLNVDANIFCGNMVENASSDMYRKIFNSERYLQKLTCSSPSFMVAGKSDNLDISSRCLYQSYQVLHSPLMELSTHGKPLDFLSHWYYTYTIGCCDFFMMDIKDESIEQNQFMAMCTFLDKSSTRIKCIVTASPIIGQNGWQKKNQSKILDLCILNGPVVILSGSSESCVYVHPWKGKNVYQVCSGAVFNPFPVAAHSNIQILSTQVSKYRLSTSVTSRCLITTEMLTVQVIGRKGRILDQTEIKFNP